MSNGGWWRNGLQNTCMTCLPIETTWPIPPNRRSCLVCMRLTDMSNPKRLRYKVLTETYESRSAITNDRKRTSRRLNNQWWCGVAHCPMCLDSPDRMPNPRSLERVTHRRSYQLSYRAQQHRVVWTIREMVWCSPLPDVFRLPRCQTQDRWKEGHFAVLTNWAIGPSNLALLDIRATQFVNLRLLPLAVVLRAYWRYLFFAPVHLFKLYLTQSGGSVVRAFAPWAGGRGFDPWARHTKDVIQMVPDASLLGAQHIRTGLAFVSSQTSFKN